MLTLRLRELREKNKMTQQEVANSLCISRDAYSLYELGKRHMNYGTICRLADIYNVSIDYLIGRYNTNPVELNNIELEVVNQFRLLDDRGKDTIRANIAYEITHAPQRKIKKSAM